MAGNFQESFIQEAQELLKDLEGALLMLEDDYSDIQQVGEVFRVMHSLKGSANMFGFSKVGEITHDLETIYDQIRSAELDLNKEILNVSLKTLDHITELINNQDQVGEEEHEALLKDIKSLVRQEETGGENTSSPKASAGKIKTFYIEVLPDKDILSNGTNPFFLIEDLINLGTSYVKAITDNIPEIENLIPSECYIFWQLVLITKQEESDIDDVFIFVEDECNVKKELIAEKDLSKEASVSAYLKEEKVYDLSRLKALNEETKVKKSASKKKPTVSVDKTIRIDSGKVDDLMGVVSQLVTAQGSLNLFAENLKDDSLLDISEHIEKLSRQLRDLTFSMSLLPLDSVMIRFKRMVRDLSDSLGKKIDFIIEGGDTELDKNIIESITDPLMHMLRNSLDHGIELPAERIAKGKNETGLIHLRAYHSGAYVTIEIKDDGKGINPDIIKKKAIEKGIISAEEQLSREETLELLFAPGFSTASSVTDISGRGVGMDVVKQKINELRGDVSIESEIDEGSKFKIRLPLTMSIIDGLLVRVATQNYVLPLFTIDKCFEIDYSQLNQSETSIIILDNQAVPFILLNEEFKENTEGLKRMQIVVLEVDGKKMGVIVEEIIGELQAVIKPLGAYYRQQEMFSGSTILGDGRVALIMDPDRMYKNFVNKELYQ